MAYLLIYGTFHDVTDTEDGQRYIQQCNIDLKRININFRVYKYTPHPLHVDQTPFLDEIMQANSLNGFVNLLWDAYKDDVTL